MPVSLGRRPKQKEHVACNSTESRCPNHFASEAVTHSFDGHLTGSCESSIEVVAG